MIKDLTNEYELLIKEFPELINLSLEVKDNPFLKVSYYQEENIYGYIKYSVIYDRIEIDDIFVNEKYRNRGIGSKLIDHIIKNNLSITLEVNENNAFARKLYLNKGFVEVAIRKNYYGNDNAILMERKVI